jgi:hypothetical protein
MNPILRRVVSTTLAVGAAYVVVCAVLLFTWRDPGSRVSVATGIGRIMSSSFMVVTGLFALAGSLGLSLRRYRASPARRKSSLQGADAETFKTGVNGMPLDACGYDPSGNYNGVE